MSREVARKCELQLARSGIQASITSRVKEEESLKRKILQRNRRKRYKHAGDIREDIVDFAGVRIALYFPNHVQKTEELMREIFLVRGTVHHGDQDDYSEWDETDRPYIARFSGYKGTHLRVSIKEEGRKHSVGCTLAMVSEPAKPCGQTSIPSIQDGGPSGLDAVHELKRRCSQRVARQLSSPSPEACKKSETLSHRPQSMTDAVVRYEGRRFSDGTGYRFGALKGPATLQNGQYSAQRRKLLEAQNAEDVRLAAWGFQGQDK